MEENWSKNWVAEVGRSSHDYPKFLEIGKYVFLELINQGNNWRQALKEWGIITYYFGIVGCSKISIAGLFVTSPNK